MTPLEAAAVAYRAAHDTLRRTHTAALAASQAYTDAQAHARNHAGYQADAWTAARDAKAAMGAAWRACDKAMHAEWAARDALCAAAVDDGQLDIFGNEAA